MMRGEKREEISELFSQSHFLFDGMKKKKKKTIRRNGKVREAKPHHHQNWHPYLSAFKKSREKEERRRSGWRDGEEWIGFKWNDAKNNGTEEIETKQFDVIDLISSVCHSLQWHDGTKAKQQEQQSFHLYLCCSIAYVTCISSCIEPLTISSDAFLYTLQTQAMYKLRVIFFQFFGLCWCPITVTTLLVLSVLFSCLF